MEPEKYQYYDPNYVPGAFGFHNTAAICWMNSLLQFLLGLPAFNKVLMEEEDNLASNNLAIEVIKLLKTILPNEPTSGSSSNNNQHTLIDPKSDSIDPMTLAPASSKILVEFLRRLKAKNINLKLGMSEECANEGFVWFLDMLGSKRLEQLFLSRYDVSFTCPGCGKESFKVIDKLFQIEIFTKVRIDTEATFVDWLKVHPEEGDCYKCELCGHVVGKFNKMRKLTRMSEIIVIVFNKFYEKTRRWFPKSISFRQSKGRPDLVYKLVGKVEHSGTMNGGHYWAQSLRDGSWICLNDNAMPSIGNPEPTPETYMIAYHLMPPGQ